MKKRMMIGWVLGIPALVIALILIIVLHEPEKDGITRAVAAKSAVLVLLSPKELEDWQKEQGASRFDANSMDEWYVPYLDYLYAQGIWDEEEIPATEKAAQGMLTYGEAAKLAGSFSPELKRLIQANRKNEKKAFSQELWWLFYDSLLKEADRDHQVQESRMQVYGTVETVPGTAPWTAHTNLGLVGFSGLALDPYIDHQLRVYHRDREVIHVLEDEGQDFTYENVWLAGGDENHLTVFQGDLTRQFELKKSSKRVGEWVQNLADLQMKDGKVAKVSLKKERITAKVLSVREEGIELEGYGLIPYEENCLILKTYGTLERQKPEDILVGYDMQEFVVARGKLCAVLTVRELDADKIRVLLMDNGFQNLFHSSVTLRCGGEMTLTSDGQESKIPAGEELVLTPEDARLDAGRLIICPPEGEEICVASLERSEGQPSYGGRLEVLRTEEGLVLVNELYLEDYLKKVVPSEMPAEYELEALKAQAVCARTYAYMQLQSNTYSQYGAHVDDSTNFQVYNNIPTDERTERAVEETYGKMLFYQGSPVSAYYFSTSCGVTADNTVWGGDASAAPYLKSVTLNPARKTLDLSSNSAFAAFIKEDMAAYDASYPFFRWSVVTNTDILTENIGGVGTVQSIKITERCKSGAANRLLVSGSEGEKTVTGQNAIRAALGDGRLSIKRKDGKTSEGWRSLPSGFLAIEDLGTNDNGTHQFKIYGGGYGHGVGMSQNGAQGMAKSGMGYEEILRFYYDGISIEG